MAPNGVPECPPPSFAAQPSKEEHRYIGRGAGKHSEINHRGAQHAVSQLPVWCALFLIFFSLRTMSLIVVLWSGKSPEQSKPSSSTNANARNPSANLQLEEAEHWSWHNHKLRTKCTVNPLRLRVFSRVSQSALRHAGRLTVSNHAPKGLFSPARPNRLSGVPKASPLHRERCGAPDATKDYAGIHLPATRADTVVFHLSSAPSLISRISHPSAAAQVADAL
jgi:hypothetical protein